MKSGVVVALVLFLGLLALTPVLATQATDSIILTSIPDPSPTIVRSDVYIIIWNNGTTSNYLTKLVHNWGNVQVGSMISSVIGNDRTGYTNVMGSTSASGGRSVNLTLSNLLVEPGSYVEWHYSYFASENSTPVNFTTKVSASFNDSSILDRTQIIRRIGSVPKINTAFNIAGSTFNKTAAGANNGIYSSSTKTLLTMRATEYVGTQFSGFAFTGNVTMYFPSSFTNLTPESGGTVNAICVASSCRCPISSLAGANATCKVSFNVPLVSQDTNYQIFVNTTSNSTSGGSNVVRTAAEWLIRVSPPPPPGQAEDVVILTSIPDPSPIIVNSDVYIIIWNNGSTPVYLTNLRHNWSSVQIGSIASSVIGNDNTGYSNVAVNTSRINNGRAINLALPGLLVEPGSYVEWHYNYAAPGSGDDDDDDDEGSGSSANLTTRITATFNDSSTANRTKVIQRIPTAAKLNMVFNIQGSQFSKTAAGANDSLLNDSRAVLTMIATEYTGSQFPSFFPYTGNITMYFPAGFTNLTPEPGGDVTAVCGTSSCRCPVSGVNGGTVTCKISFDLPNLTDTSSFVVYANATSSSSVGQSNKVKTSAEWLIRVPPIFVVDNPPVIHSVQISPTQVTAPGLVRIAANVTDDRMVSFVQAIITGPQGRTLPLFLESGITYSNNFSLPLEGTYSANFRAGDNRGQMTELLGGTFSGIAPVFPPPLIECEGIYSLGIALQPAIIDVDKTRALLGLNYYCARNLLGLWTYNFYFELRYMNDTFVQIDGEDVRYGLYPPTGATVFELDRAALLRTSPTTFEQVTVTIGVWVV
jgi:hypothetical protein